MAESTSTATAPSGGPGAKGSSATWWKSLTSRKKCKETLSASPGGPTELLYSQPSTSDSRENQPSIVSSGSRRNLKISRSGRFKEKRKARVTLLAESPQKLFEERGGGTSSSTSAHPSEETPCQ